MATPYKISLGSRDVGSFHRGGYNAAASAKVSEVLQHNMENWNIHFSGLRHNHIVHCILTILGLGASPEELQKNYDREAAYQKPRYPIDEDVVKAMAHSDQFAGYLDQLPQYSNFLLFFQREIEAKGVKKTLEEYVFAGTDLSNGVFARLFCSIFHGYLHLGYAFEYNQPALVAEALAMSCIHDPNALKMAGFFSESEKLAGGPRQPGENTLRQIMESMRDKHAFQTSINGQDKVDRSKNVMDNARQEVIRYASQYSISPDQLEERMYEMVDTCSLLIATKPAPIKDGEPYKIDFFLLHVVNTLVLMPTLVNHEWISRENAVRLIEWAGRCHLLAYVSQTAPPITPAEIDHYPVERQWNEIFERAINHPSDDGHLQKCIRSVAFGEKLLSERYGQAHYQIKPETWLRLANFVVDRVPYEAKTSEQRWLLFF